jgi:FkbM family methyltransferase
MNKILIGAGTWLWKYLPVRLIRQGMWTGFLWWVRGKRKVATIDGVTFDLDLGELIDACIYVHRFEREVTDFIDTTCKKEFVVLDIGANIGAHCLRFASIVGEKGRVYAFEPTNYAYAKLQKNISLNKFVNIKTFQVALADRSLAQQTISYRSSWRTDGSFSQESSVIDFVRLDDWVAENGIDRVDLIKIDVDGNEYSVISGGRELFEKFKPMVIAEVGLYHFENPSKNPWAILSEIGYSFWDMRTKEPFKNIEQIRESFLKQNKGFDSINVVAGVGGKPKEW